MDKVNLDKRMKLTILLSLLFFISGVLFFYFRMNDGGGKESNVISLKGRQMKSKHEDREIILKDMPSPDSFDSFIYKGEEEKKVDIKCSGEYATILIYEDGVDYRYDPLGAKFNTAYPCEGREKFEQVISIKSANLKNGIKYYLVRASQDSGGWYDPY